MNQSLEERHGDAAEVTPRETGDLRSNEDFNGPLVMLQLSDSHQLDPVDRMRIREVPPEERRERGRPGLKSLSSPLGRSLLSSILSPTLPLLPP
ncbi:hypothetical protein EYF80_028964 [Liparis tanakae]|uniref:Uncharacterized protein n=1 Tax=Liparis tanakae TaxID=230148 RepID=A0A4Z2H7I8_9TELE|nr:hypothetical protein EYF80_028964 [Liparis tanakae]